MNQLTAVLSAEGKVVNFLDINLGNGAKEVIRSFFPDRETCSVVVEPEEELSSLSNTSFKKISQSIMPATLHPANTVLLLPRNESRIEYESNEYVKSESKYTAHLSYLDAEKGVWEAIESIMSKDNDELTPTNVFTPHIEYGGKLPVAPENNFSLNHERENVKFFNKEHEAKISISYGGKLPVGRER
ncbi:hypothetical protein P4607_22975 [Priestia megaterium]|uniref:hypothetical protein n=1 Tax=Priestia megaterium TaxID=1404 RepID=UPI002E20437B|nr:hypothetical protein [Priestia megaterium]